MRIRLFLLSLVISVSSVYCFAQEKAVPEPVLEGLRQQMKQIDTLKAEYTVNGILGQSQKQIKTEVSYIKKGDKYNMSEYAYEGDEKIRETKTVYDGISIKELNFNKKENRSLGTIHSRDMYDVLITRNDIRSLVAGFAFIRKQYEENSKNFVFKNLGTEMLDGRDCVKIVMISPYLRGQKAYDYLWIEAKDEKYYFMKEVCLIEDNPNQLLYTRQYNYNYSDNYPIPRKIYYERFDIDDKGNRTPNYKLNSVIEDFSVNIPVDDSEFVYFFPEGTMVNSLSTTIDPKAITDPNWTDKPKPPNKVIEVNQPAPDNRIEFPIGGGCGVILIPVHIQGKEYSFVLDTGSTSTVFDSSLRDLLGEPKRIIRAGTMANPTIMQMFESPEVQVGTYKLLQGSEVTCLDLSAVSMADGRKIDGLLGMDFLKHHMIQIDFDKSIISFPVLNETDMSGYEQQLEIVYNSQGLPQLKGLILGDTETTFTIDSGYNSTGMLDSKIFDKMIKSENVKTIETIAATASGIQKSREARINQLFIGSYEYKNLIFSEGNMMILGIEFLDRHEVIMDFPNKKMYLRKGKQFDRKDETGMSGLALLRISTRLTVHSIFQSSPAEKAGIKTGDIIMQVEGKDEDEYSLKQLKQLFRSEDGRKINLQIERDGELKEIVIILKREI